MSRQNKDKDGRVILFENETVRLTKVLCPLVEAYQFMVWEKNDGVWTYKETVSDWNP